MSIDGETNRELVEAAKSVMAGPPTTGAALEDMQSMNSEVPGTKPDDFSDDRLRYSKDSLPEIYDWLLKNGYERDSERYSMETWINRNKGVHVTLHKNLSYSVSFMNRRN